MNIQTHTRLRTQQLPFRSSAKEAVQPKVSDSVTLSSWSEEGPDALSAIVYGSVGTAAGAVAGVAFSGDLQGALIGAGIGLVSGGVFGAFAVPHINL